MKINVGVVRLCCGGWHRHEVGSWLIEVVQSNHPNVDNIYHIPVDQVYTPGARNLAVEVAMQQGYDILVMVDDDMVPAKDFFRRSIDFLLSQPTPSVVASAYVCGPPTEMPQIIRWHDQETGTPQDNSHLEHVSRPESMKAKGYERVAAVGTGLIAFHMGVFQKIRPPYFYYEFDSEKQTKVVCTEDVVCTRDLSMAGVPVWADWDHWSDHWKAKRCRKPEPIDLDHFPNRMREEVEAALSVEKRRGPAPVVIPSGVSEIQPAPSVKIEPCGLKPKPNE